MGERVSNSIFKGDLGMVNPDGSIAILKPEGEAMRYDANDLTPIGKGKFTRWIELQYSPGDFDTPTLVDAVADDIRSRVSDKDMRHFLAALAHELYKDEGI